MNTYKTTHRAKCPNGNLTDAYEITIRSAKTIMVEDIAKAIKSAADPIYQEDFATHLRVNLGAEIAVTGWHHGVFVECLRA